jgi:hypothetical protein
MAIIIKHVHSLVGGTSGLATLNNSWGQWVLVLKRTVNWNY